MSELSCLACSLQLGRCPHELVGLRLFGGFTTWLEYLQCLLAKVLLVALLEVVDTNEHRVVHDVQLLHQLHILPHLLNEGVLLRGPQLKMQVSP